MNELFFEVTDRANSLQKYNFFLKNMQAKTTLKKEVELVLERKPICRVLDIGCGEAQALKELKQIFGENVFAIGIDLIDTEKEGLDQFIRANAVETVFPANLDLVVSFRSIHFFHPIQKVFKSVFQSLAQSGKAFLSVRCQQMVLDQLLFHGNLTAQDLNYMKKLAREKTLGRAKVMAVEVKEKKSVLVVDPSTGDKKPAELEIIHGINFFIEK